MRKILIILLLLTYGIAEGQDSTALFRYGKLKNGLTYYIRHNGARKWYADFYLVQNVGALMEDAHQNGLAHFLEHMAFNGSESFPEGIPHFLGRRGIREFNAQTGQDETVYYMNGVSLREKGLVDSCLLVLKDWSGFLLLKPEEIDKERGVIFEERRLRRNLEARIDEKIAPLIFNHSKYAVHNVIGTLDVLKNFTPAELRAYYHDYYRPDLQAVIVVGDVDVARIEAEIQHLFGPVPRHENPRPREICEISDNEEPLYKQVSDPEQTEPAMVLTKRVKETIPATAKEMMKENLIQQFYSQILQKYLQAYNDTHDPAFLLTSVDYNSLIRNYSRFRIYVEAYPHKEKEALREILEVIENVNRFGLNEQELKAQTNEYMKGLKETEEMKDKLPNDVFVQIYQNNFLEGKPITTIDEDIALSHEILEELTPKDLQDWVTSWYDQDDNWVFIMRGNDEKYKFPASGEILDIIQQVRKEKLQPLDFTIQAVPLMDFTVEGGKIIREKKIKPLDAEVWTLSNGCKVYYKYSDTDGPKVSLTGKGPGGKAMLATGDLPSATAMTSLMLHAGLYKHDRRMLEEIMKGHTVMAGISFGDSDEGVKGICEKQDAGMMFQLIWLFFEKPRFDRDDFDKYVYLQKMRYNTTPFTVNDTIAGMLQKLKAVDSPRIRKMDGSFYDDMDYDRMVAIYKDRFGDVSDFTFYLTGNIGREEAQQLAARYLASLPVSGRIDKPWKYDFRRKGSLTETIEANIPDEKYIVNIEYRNTLKLKAEEELCMDMISMVLSDRYRADIREDQGGAYGVNVGMEYANEPEPWQFLGISFQTSLEKGDRMRELVHEQIGKLLREGVSEEEVGDAVLTMKKGRASMLRNRGINHWTQALQYYAVTGKDVDSPAGFEKVIDKINAEKVQDVAKKFFGTSECQDIVIKSKGE